MRINNNISAVITNNQLLGNEQSLSDVMEKLSSGFNINHASDDPSGIAIAGRMQAQIDGLDQASSNSDDGISMLETAEGALNEVTLMLQRMRELCVQAANGTNSDTEKTSIQKEIDSLKDEVDRISETTQFNTINLLDGTLDNRVYNKDGKVTRLQSSDKVAEGEYQIYIKSAATQATVSSVKTTTAYTYSEVVTNTNTKKVIQDISIPGDTDATTLESRIDSCTYTISTTNYAHSTGNNDSNGNPIYTQVGDTKKVTSSGFPIAGSISINGYTVTLTQGMTGEEVYLALRDGAEKGGATISDPNSTTLSFTSKYYGTDENLKIVCSSEVVARALGLDISEGENEEDEDGTKQDALDFITTGKNADVLVLHNNDVYDSTTGELLDSSSTSTSKATATSLFGAQAMVSSDGNDYKITDVNGFEISCQATAKTTGLVIIDVTDIGGLTLHVGANENQTMDIRIKNTSVDYLYIDDLNVEEEDGAEKGMDALDDAIEYITGVRSQLGAYENRLEHTKSSLDTTSENMTSAISRVEDVDMATAMVEYTKYNVLEQAGTSALSQANELPQLALQLLQ